MKKILLFSFFLMLGLVVSQFLPAMVGEGVFVGEDGLQYPVVCLPGLYHDKCGAGVRNG